MKKGSFTSNFLVLFSGTGIAQIAPFIFAPLIARLFSEEEIAVRANFLALASMLAIAAAGRYEMAIVLSNEKKKAMNLLALSVRLILIVSALSILFYVFRDWVDSFYKEGQLGKYLILLVVAVPLYAFTNVFTQVLIREKKFKSLTSSAIARSVFVNLFAVLFGYAAYDAMGLILGTIIGLFVALIMMYLSVKNSLDSSLISKDEIKSVAKEYRDFPIVNAPHAFVDLLFSQFILYAIITRDFGLKELGFYVMMSSLLINSMKAIGGSLGQLYYKEASERLAKKEDVFFALFRSIKIVLVFAIPGCLLVFFFGPKLFEWFLGGDYARSGEYAQIMILPIFISFVVSPISATPIIYRKQTVAFIFSLIGYSLSIAALVLGSYLKFDFSHTLMLFAAAQFVYFLGLLIWYIYLTKSTK